MSAENPVRSSAYGMAEKARVVRMTDHLTVVDTLTASGQKGENGAYGENGVLLMPIEEDPERVERARGLKSIQVSIYFEEF